MANDLESTISKLATEFARAIVSATRQDFASQIAGLVGGATSRGRRGRPPGKTTARRASGKRNYPKHCLKCSKPHSGPRSSFMCADHAGTAKGEKRALLATWKEKKGA